MTLIIALSDVDAATAFLESYDGAYEILPVEGNGDAYVGVSDPSQYLPALSRLARLAADAGIARGEILAASDPENISEAEDAWS